MSKNPRAASVETDGRPKGRPKSSSGVQATLERMTGKSPCPRYLLQTANKYLRTRLFDVFVPPGKKASNEEKLSHPAARTLLLNALELDDLFLGDTSTVITLLQKGFSAEQLEEKLSAAQRSVSWRYERYAYWHRRGAALNAVMTKPDLDFRSVRVDELLNQQLPHEPAARGGTFAMRAMQELERIEERGRLAGPNADSLAEQAEAYLNLGDYREAAKKAKQATEIDQHHATPRAWFLRVVAALNRRNEARREVQHYGVEAVEVAEPMSAHERSAYERQAEAEDRLDAAQRDLEEILPQALLNWPRLGNSSFERLDWRGPVRDQFLDQMFRKLSFGYGFCDSGLAVLNDLGPEWLLRFDNPQVRQLPNTPDVSDLPLAPNERAAMSLLFEEHARYRSSFFTPGDLGYLVRDFKVLHVRWVLRNPNYSWHWSEWSRDAARSNPDCFEEQILSNANIACLWVSHVARHGGASAVLQVVSQWRGRARKQRDGEVLARSLQILLMVFHHQLARENWAGCWATCLEAEELDLPEGLGAQRFAHPMESMITIPAGNALYWQYLKALCAVKARFAGCTLNADASAMLAQSETWRQRFENREICFWTCEEVYEGGGGEDYPVAPYDIDLTVPIKWHSPTPGRDDSFGSFAVVGAAS